MKKLNLTSYILISAFTLLANNSWASSQLTPTIYYIKTIDPNQSCDSKKSIYSVEGKVIATVCKEAYNHCVIEGTCALLKKGTKTQLTDELSSGSSAAPSVDFQVINYIKMKDGRPVFSVVDEDKCPWGLGVSAICLDPYFTVAADLKFHKAGDVIFVDKLKGTKLPTGEIHDGFLIVRDKGGAIDGKDRFDFYTGILPYRDERNPFTALGLNSKNNRFEYRNATTAEAEQVRKARNYPRIP